MEIDLKNEESTETSIFANFSIRKYVAEIHKKNPAKCWPFGSLRNPYTKVVVSSYQSSESKFLSGKNCPGNINGSDDITEVIEAANCMIESLGVDNNIGKAVCNGSSELTFCKVNNGQIRHEVNNVDEGANIRHNKTADRLRRKHKKFRLLSDIYKDPASEPRTSGDRTNPVNVNRIFIAEIDDESDDDDVTLAAYLRKQKGVEITDSTVNKKRGIIGVEEQSVDHDKNSNHGLKDSIRKDSNVGISRKKSRTDDMDTQTFPEHKEVTPSTSLIQKDFRLQSNQKSNQFAEVSSKEATEKEKENEDSELEVVMLLARHFNEQKQILRAFETHPTCACVKKKIREHSTQCGNKPITKTSSKTATKHQVKKITNEKLENAFCSVQRMSFMPMKATTSGGFQSHVEMSMMKAAGVGSDARNCATLVCSFNKNPADFTTPIGENKFMRG